MPGPAEPVHRVDDLLGDLCAWDVAEEAHRAWVPHAVQHPAHLRLEQDDQRQDGDGAPAHPCFVSSTACTTCNACRAARTLCTRNQVAPSISAATLAPVVP